LNKILLGKILRAKFKDKKLLGRILLHKIYPTKF